MIYTGSKLTLQNNYLCLLGLLPPLHKLRSDISVGDSLLPNYSALIYKQIEKDLSARIKKRGYISLIV